MWWDYVYLDSSDYEEAYRDARQPEAIRVWNLSDIFHVHDLRYCHEEISECLHKSMLRQRNAPSLPLLVY